MNQKNSKVTNCLELCTFCASFILFLLGTFLLGQKSCYRYPGSQRASSVPIEV